MKEVVGAIQSIFVFHLVYLTLYGIKTFVYIDIYLRLQDIAISFIWTKLL